MLTLQKEISNIGIEPAQRPVPQLLAYGVVVIDKPRGPSSHEVSSFVKKLAQVGRAGHSGTLDPDVSGVLPVLLENSCKIASFLLKEPKEYVCAMRTNPAVPRDDLEKAFSNFRGEIYQTPPRESAVRKALRTRKVYDLKLSEVQGGLSLFTCRVQAGTYIRTIVSDAGLVLGVQSTMAELRRTRAAGFGEIDSITLQEFSDDLWAAREKGNEAPLREVVIPVEHVLKLPKAALTDQAVLEACKGADPSSHSIAAIDPRINKGQAVGLYTGKGELVAIAIAIADAKKIISDSKGDSLEPAFDLVRVVHDFSKARGE